MSNCLLSTTILEREFMSWLPTDAVVSSMTEPNADVSIYHHGADFMAVYVVTAEDRLLSADALRDIYKPMVDQTLVNTWRLAS